MNSRELNLHVIKYEDLLNDTKGEVDKLVEFLDLSHFSDRIDKAIEFSSFDQLVEQELNKGFKIKNPASEIFFRSGKSDVWKKELTSRQVSRIRQEHEEVMKLMGYW